MRALTACVMVALFVCSLICLALGVGYSLTYLLGLPPSLGLSVPLRALGLPIILLGGAILHWVFRYRRPVDICASSYVTLMRAVKARRSEVRQMRREPLIVRGPYRYTRNPMYFSVILLWIGSWIALDLTPLLISTLFVLSVLYLIIIPLEERELREIFGEQYEEYAKRVRKLIPFIL